MNKTFKPAPKQPFQQRPPKSIYNPVQQFKHRDRGTQAGRTNISRTRTNTK